MWDISLNYPSFTVQDTPDYDELYHYVSLSLQADV